MIEPVAPVPPLAVAMPEPTASLRRTDLRQEAKDPGPVQSRAVEAVEKALKTMEPPILGRNERLSILRDEHTGTFIYRSVDRDTGEVVRQWPAEAMLQFKAYLRNTEGVVVDQSV